MEAALIQPVREDACATTGLAVAEAFVDSHVHLYPVYDRTTFFDAAERNVRRAGGTVGVLCLTERPTEDAFDQLRAGHPRPGAEPWSFEDNGEGITLLGRRAGRDGDERIRLVLIAGRQVVTAERLEVLAIGLNEAVEEGLSLEKTVLRVQGRGALAVLPWGLGKWTGRRGEAVARMIDRQSGRGGFGTALVLGDNAGRPGPGPRPPLFDMAAAKRMTLLPGSDPLPIALAQTHACSYGVILGGPFDPDHIGRQVIARLRDVGPVPRRFGDRHGLVSFVRQQVALRFAK